jgi:hypothetical protein
MYRNKEMESTRIICIEIKRWEAILYITTTATRIN